jgi:hypothetical protein
MPGSQYATMLVTVVIKQKEVLICVDESKSLYSERQDVI